MRRVTLAALMVLAGLGAGLDHADCPSALTDVGLPANAACPGPYAVAHIEYDSRAAFPDGLQVVGVDAPVDRWGLVSYPEGFPDGPAPLVLVLHGNHSPGICRAGFSPCEVHRGLTYLTDHLASQGFVAVSVNAERLNGADFDSVLERGWLLIDHLRRWRAWASAPGAPFGDLFVGHVDLSRIGLAGHSRGGEAVVAAHVLNRDLADPFAIGAVFAIAPTDKHALSVEGTPLYTLVPACDGDVLDYGGVRFFDRALRAGERLAPQQTALAVGANHNHFNTLWGTDGGGCAGIELLERPEQERLAMTLGAAFFRLTLNGETGLRHVFTGDRTGPSTPHVALRRSYADPQRLEVDDFSDGLEVNRLGGAAHLSGFKREAACGPDLQTACSAALANETTALDLAWAGEEAVYSTEIPAPYQDVRAFTHLAVRVTQNPADIRPDALVPAGAPLQFEIVLEDALGGSARLSSEPYGGAPYPIGSTVHDSQTGQALHRTALTTLRIPLAAFAGVDLERIARVGFRFPAGTAGGVYLANLQITR